MTLYGSEKNKGKKQSEMILYGSEKNKGKNEKKIRLTPTK